MDNIKKSSTDDEELIKRNLKKPSEIRRIKSDESLLHQSDTSNLSKHNEQYTALLKAYVESFECNAKSKQKNKEILFKIAKNLLVYIPIASGFFVTLTGICLVFGWIDVIESISWLFTSVLSLIGTFMAVPQMITKYLFNEKEEEHLVQIISKIQEYDRDIREVL